MGHSRPVAEHRDPGPAQGSATPGACRWRRHGTKPRGREHGGRAAPVSTRLALCGQTERAGMARTAPREGGRSESAPEERQRPALREGGTQQTPAAHEQVPAAVPPGGGRPRTPGRGPTWMRCPGPGLQTTAGRPPRSSPGAGRMRPAHTHPRGPFTRATVGGWTGRLLVHHTLCSAALGSSCGTHDGPSALRLEPGDSEGAQGTRAPPS